ncbi:hypothetical protein M8A51_22540 [Schlegelella sp. S2-27]|uniref:Uncharacterized protein n=1 Tax=Caldimonas mangrovi TaxID=2944811 RepID=A0ABT0YUA4_9BURK|nr:hypothetical protein [Caldimonas mangrovi]MCM5682316.1 hypothetical protein [Caldimonas mangrovi]
MQRIEFESAKFLPYLPEDCQVNPGAYGFELSLWLSQTLMRQGVVTSYPLGEDWGWFIEYIEGDAEFMIGCGSQAEEGEGYEGKPIAWHIFVKPQLSLKQRLKGAARPEIGVKLGRAILAALRAEGIEPRSEAAT